MNKYEKAIFNTITDCEGLYNYFRDIWKEDNSSFLISNLAFAIEDYYYEFTNHIPFLYQELLTTMLDSKLIDFWLIAENLIDLF